jgi:hypothetical protein
MKKCNSITGRQDVDGPVQLYLPSDIIQETLSYCELRVVRGLLVLVPLHSSCIVDTKEIPVNHPAILSEGSDFLVKDMMFRVTCASRYSPIPYYYCRMNNFCWECSVLYMWVIYCKCAYDITWEGYFCLGHQAHPKSSTCWWCLNLCKNYKYVGKRLVTLSKGWSIVWYLLWKFCWTKCSQKYKLFCHCCSQCNSHDKIL